MPDQSPPTVSPSDASLLRSVRAGRRVLLLGGSGTIGRAAAGALLARGHQVVALLRPSAQAFAATAPPGATLRFGDPTDAASLAAQAFSDGRIDAVVSCLASRTGAPADAWAIDHDAHLAALAAAKAHGAAHFVLLSAICAQKPRLAFQHAKRAFETALIQSGLRYSIVRPTAYFKSLSGQIERLRAGKPYLMFGDGRLTACKPISDGDLGAYLAACLERPERWDRILPIGGPGPAITPREQGERLFEILGLRPRYRRAPVALLDAIIAGLSAASRLRPALGAKAELARIARYYATESMLVWDAAAGRYDAAATPETGSETLFGFYERVARGEATVERGDHAVF